MKTLLLLLPLLSITLAQQGGGGGFFSGITGAFNNFFGGNSNSRPRQPQRRPPPPRFQQPQQQPQFQQPAPQFQQPQQPAPQFQQPAPQFQQPAPQFQQPAPQFQQQPTPQFQQPAPQFQPAQNQQFRRPQAPAAQQVQPTRLRGGTSLCSAAEPNHFWTDPRDNKLRGYVVTWKNGCITFQQHEARAYCESMDMAPVSLDSPAKQDQFNRLIAQDAQRYFWTGGIVDHANQQVGWANPNGAVVKFSDSAHWSHTGGAGLPQPDNRAAGENPPLQETCLGILNNFYADGIKWHDVACHHKKPTVCEPLN